MTGLGRAAVGMKKKNGRPRGAGGTTKTRTNARLGVAGRRTSPKTNGRSRAGTGTRNKTKTGPGAARAEQPRKTNRTK
jgi:hypothetical protein